MEFTSTAGFPLREVFVEGSFAFSLCTSGTVHRDLGRALAARNQRKNQSTRREEKILRSRGTKQICPRDQRPVWENVPTCLAIGSRPVRTSRSETWAKICRATSCSLRLQVKRPRSTTWNIHRSGSALHRWGIATAQRERTTIPVAAGRRPRCVFVLVHDIPSCTLRWAKALG